MTAPSMSAQVAELMNGLGFKAQPTPNFGAGEIAPSWVLSEGDVVALAQACVEQVGAMASHPEAAPLELQANACRNASVVADFALAAGGVFPAVATLCPYPDSHSLSGVWMQAFESRKRWHQSGRIVS